MVTHLTDIIHRVMRANGCQELMTNEYSCVRYVIAVYRCRSVHNTRLIIAPPTKYPTPYGGRLEWQMPGGNKLIVHLKNAEKIRRGKRWSQVYYTCRKIMKSLKTKLTP